MSLGEWLNAPAEDPTAGLVPGAEVEFSWPVGYRNADHHWQSFSRGILDHYDPEHDLWVVVLSAEDPRLVMGIPAIAVERYLKLPKPKTNAQAFTEMLADAERDRRRTRDE